jgi:hypothetical protein
MKPRCYWEHLEECIWEHDENTSIWEQGEKIRKPLPLFQKQKNWNIHECMLSLPKTVPHHFLPGLIALPKSWGTYYSTS